jgi:hypothetical protein
LIFQLKFPAISGCNPVWVGSEWQFITRVAEDAGTPFVGGQVYDIDASGSEVKFPAGSLQRFRELSISVVSVTDTKGNQYEPYEGVHVQLEKKSGVGSDPLADPHFALYYRYKLGPMQ